MNAEDREQSEENEEEYEFDVEGFVAQLESQFPFDDAEACRHAYRQLPEVIELKLRQWAERHRGD